MKVGIFVADSNGGYPVPASKGGAVSTLVEHLVKENSKIERLNLTVVTFYDEQAYKLASQYQNINFIWITSPSLIKVIDEVIFKIIIRLFKNKKAISYKSIASLVYYIIKSAKLIKSTDFEKIILENNIPLAWIIKLSKFKREYYYHFHNIPRLNAKCKEVFLGCEKILCVSDYVGKQIESSNNPIGPIGRNKIHTLYNCVDTVLFKKYSSNYSFDVIKTKYDIKCDDKVVVFVGRLTKEKGLHVLLDAIKKVNIENLKLLIVGSYFLGDKKRVCYDEDIDMLANELKEIVRFTGYIPQEELPVIYNMADVAVLPSMWDEPAGLTMVEAMACGLPVITTNSGGIAEYVSNAGIILEKDENLVENIAYNIEMLLTVQEKRDYYSRLGAKRVQEAFDSKNYLHRLCDIIF